MPPIGNAPNGSSPAYLLPVNGAPSTSLVKRERARFPGFLQNELACMTMMAAAGVPTVAHTICALDAGAYETARFDRRVNADRKVTRAYAEDGCQLTGKRSGAKYARTGGPGYSDLVAALRRYTVEPGKDAVLLFRWAVANLALGNRDAHAKNVSLVGEVPTVLELAPAYDVICTMASPRKDSDTLVGLRRKRLPGELLSRKWSALRCVDNPAAQRSHVLTSNPENSDVG